MFILYEPPLALPSSVATRDSPSKLETLLSLLRPFPKVLLSGSVYFLFSFPFTRYTNVPYFSFTLFFLMALLMALLVFW